MFSHGCTDAVGSVRDSGQLRFLKKKGSLRYAMTLFLFSGFRNGTDRNGIY